jgi:hypothetical protein
VVRDFGEPLATEIARLLGVPRYLVHQTSRKRIVCMWDIGGGTAPSLGSQRLIGEYSLSVDGSLSFRRRKSFFLLGDTYYAARRRPVAFMHARSACGRTFSLLDIWRVGGVLGYGRSRSFVYSLKLSCKFFNNKLVSSFRRPCSLATGRLVGFILPSLRKHLSNQTCGTIIIMPYVQQETLSMADGTDAELACSAEFSHPLMGSAPP